MQNAGKSRLALLLSLATLLSLPAMAPAQTQRNTAVADAQKRVVEAQSAVTDLKSEQKRIKDKLVADFGEKEEWKNTVTNLAKAKKEYDAAKRQALLAMKNSPDYKKTLKERDDLQAKMEELNKARDPDPKAITKTGTLLAQQGTALKKLESAAMEQDAKALDAKEALDKAEKEMKALSDEVDAALQSDPEYAQLQTQVDQADMALASAKESLIQTKKSSRPAPRAPSTPRRTKGGEEGP